MVGGPIRFSTTKKVTGIRARLLALDDGSIKAARMNKQQRQRSLPTLGVTSSNSSKRKSSTKITTRATRTKQSSSSSPSTAAITATASAAVTAVMKLSSATKSTSASTTTTKKAAPATNTTKATNKRKAREYDDDDDEDYIDEDYVEEEEKQEEALLDKVEFSPTGRASCKACRKKIAKGAKRIGVSDYFHRFKSYGYVYYHDRCCPAKVKENLRLENAPTTSAMKRPKLGTTPANTMKHRINQRIESAYQQQQAIADAKRHTLQHDPLVKDLRIALMALRREFAKRMNLAAKRRNIHNRYTSPAFIFSDDTLDELALQMPQTKQEFLGIPGIGEKKFQSFGDSFLMLISYYHSKKQQGKQQQRSSLSRNRQQPSLQSTTMRARRLRSSASLCVPSSAPAKPNDPEVIIIDDSDDERVDNNPRRTTKEKSKKKQKISHEEEEDEDIIVEESLTCEEIVNRKFQHAEENGYVIEI